MGTLKVLLNWWWLERNKIFGNTFCFSLGMGEQFFIKGGIFHANRNLSVTWVHLIHSTLLVLSNIQHNC